MDPSAIQRLIPPTLMANNLGIWTGDSYTLSDTCKQRLADVDVPMLRFPGGSMSDTYHWNGIYPPHAAGQGWDSKSQPWALDTVEFMELCSELDVLPLVTVNHGYHEYDTTATDGSLANAAALAADWVEYCNAPNNGSNPGGGVDWAAQRAADGHPEPFRVKYWEVGNEVYGDWEVGNEEEDGAIYAAQFNVIRDAMKAIDPSVYVGICAYVGDDTAYAWTEEVFSHPGVAERIDFIDIHDYFQWVGFGLEGDLDEAEIFSLVDQVSSDKADLDQLVWEHIERPPGAVKYYMGEYNLTNPHNYHNTQLVVGLATAEVLGELIENGFHGASFWMIANAWSSNGDHGFMARFHPTVPDYTPFAAYYPFFFYTRNFGDRSIASTSDDPEVAVYASRFSTGELGLILVNETDADRTASIDLGSFATAGPINSWVLSGSELASTAVTLNGLGNEMTHGGPLLEDVEPYVWDADAPSSISLDLPRYSATSLVIY